MQKNKSSQAVGAEIAERIEAYVEKALRGQIKVPIRRGRINITQICALPEVRITTSSTLRTNKRVAESFEKLRECFDKVETRESPEMLLPNSEERELKRQLDTVQRLLETKNSEIEALRRQIKRHEMEEELLINTGRQLHPWLGEDIEDDE